MASIDLKNPVLILSQVFSMPIHKLYINFTYHMIIPQFPDSQTYVKVVTKLHVLRPLEVGIAGSRNLYTCCHGNRS